MKKCEIVFYIDDPEYICPPNSINNPPSIEILKISKDGFYYKGQKVEDKQDIYNRFNEWLKLTGK